MENLSWKVERAEITDRGVKFTLTGDNQIYSNQIYNVFHLLSNTHVYSQMNALCILSRSFSTTTIFCKCPIIISCL